MSGNHVSYNIEFTDTNAISVTSEYAESREIIRKKQELILLMVKN